MSSFVRNISLEIHQQLPFYCLLLLSVHVFVSFREDRDVDYIDIRLVEEDDEFEDAKFKKCRKPQWAESKCFFQKHT